MSEDLSQLSYNQAPDLANQAFNVHLDIQSQAMDEVLHKRAEIELAGRELIDEFGIKPELFEDPGRSFAFSAIAERKASAIPNDSDFVSNAVSLLAYRYSDQLAHLRPIMEADSAINESQREKILDKYTHNQLSKDLVEAIQGGLLDGVKDRMGIKPEDEEPYDIRVLTIDPNGETSHGIVSESLPEWDSIPGANHKEKSANFEKEILARSLLQVHKEDLKKRAEDMHKELGTVPAMAWVRTNGETGKRTLCISMPLAEKILTPDVTNNATYYGEGERQRDFAILEHEYVHTQRGLHIDQDIYFGISLEERRAEFFSGDKQGYQDIKGLLTDVAAASDVNITDMLAARQFGGNQSEVFTEIANKIGLRSTLELLLTPPQVYFKQSGDNPFQRAVVEHIGGYDGLIAGIISRSISNGQKSEVDRKVNIYAERVKKINTEDEGMGDWVLNYRRQFGLNVMTDLYQKRVAEITPNNQSN